MKEQLAQDCTFNASFEWGEHCTRYWLTETTLMDTSWYTSEFSIVCSHCVNSIATSLMLTWRGGQCGIFLPISHIYLRVLFFIRMESHQQKTYGRPTRLQIRSFISERKIFSEKKKTQNPQMRPSLVHIPLLTTYLSPPVVFIRVFPDILKLIPSSLLNYLHYGSTANPHCARHYTPTGDSLWHKEFTCQIIKRNSFLGESTSPYF